MPAPSPNLVPKQEYWGFVQKDIAPAELRTLAGNIITYDNQIVNDAAKIAILSFLNSSTAVQQWSDYWVTIIHTLGIAYITSDNRIHKTKLANFLAGGGDPTEFYLLWSQLFQFPFAQSKHKEFKENNIVVNPGQIIITALVQLFYISANTGNNNPFREAYLTPEEIVLVLMKSRSNDTYEIIHKANTIYTNRLFHFDYNTIKIEGDNSNRDNFSGRARLYLEKSGIIRFKANRDIYIQDWKHYVECQNFLCYRKNGMPIHVATEEQDRIRFFEKVFNHSTSPKVFSDKVHAFDREMAVGTVEPDEVKGITDKMSAKGYVFSESFIERFLLAAKAKPFIILSGISGVGKSLLPRALMEILNNGSCRPIAVSPDWTDNSDMLGYFGANGSFVVGELTNVLLDASQNLHIPYFIVLDEMNLAKVEYYFAQILSVMESRYYDAYTGGAEYADYLFNAGVRKRLASSNDEYEKKLAQLKIPSNVVIVGTVNIDESTHPFSKKVLDRANVLEVNEIDLMAGLNEMATSGHPVSILPSSKNYVGCITNLKELYTHWTLNVIVQQKFDCRVFVEKWITELKKFNEILKKHHLNFGLRMRDEVCIYMYYAAMRNVDSSNPNWDLKYLDHQFIQKGLTRLVGEEGEIENTIEDLFKLCFTDPGEFVDQESIINYTEFEGTNGKYPLTARKLQNMLYSLVVSRKPMASFWTS